jgi:UDPglucose 6-dehydrogenase
MYDIVTASVTFRCAGPPYAPIRSRAFRTSDCLTEEDTLLKPRSIEVQAPRAKRVYSSIAVLGTNYVGLVTAACLAQLGHTVIGVDVDPLKVARLQRGQLPIYEPSLEAIVVKQLATGRLRFTLDYAASLPQVEFAFVCVGTPPGPDGSSDMRQVHAATESLARHTPAGAHLVVVNKSTMPVGTGQWIQTTLNAHARQTGAHFSIVSNPEFLREGSAVSDFQHPDRIVLGGAHASVLDRVANLYDGMRPRPPIVRTDLRSAEMIKYASNAFLATKISFINEIAAICDRLGADVKDVAHGMGLDQRIGPRFLAAGVGYGGSCFPKDLMALEHMASQAGAEPRILRAVMDTNRHTREAVVATLRAEMGSFRGRCVGILGLAFKSDTDDVRESPSIEIARTLLADGAQVSAYDPAAMGSAALVLPQLELRKDAYAVAESADVLLVLTEWPEFRQLDFARIRDSMRQAVLVDGRNLLDPAAMKAVGFGYRGIGRATTSALALAA